MTKANRLVSRAGKSRARAQHKQDKKFMVHRKRNLALMPHLIREWAKNVLGEFEDKGLIAGSVMPKPPTSDNELWRVVFALPTGLQCAECGEMSQDSEARYTVFSIDDTKWLSASCFACHKSREPGNVVSPQKGDA
ncbi:MAG: hypothetical protein ACTSX8_03520 [Alphaproteobacteria bacterium]